MGTRERRDRSNQADRDLSGIFHSAAEQFSISAESIALSAVGGYGRGELSPGSDLDVLILHDGSVSTDRLTEFVNALLYPLWNANRAVDHSVRTRNETRTTASEDLRVAQGLLDIRFIAGNRDLVNSVAADALGDWRKNFSKNKAGLRASINERAGRSGELAFLLEPDLKESRGGLRDINALRAIARTDNVPVSMDRLSSAEALLLSVRDALHSVTGRSRDQLLLTEQDKVAELLQFADADVLMYEVAKAARAVDYVMDLTWHRLDHVTKTSFFHKNKSQSIGRGISVTSGEVTVDEAGDLSDATLGLRAAALAAQRGLPLSVESAMLLAANFRSLPTPWPRSTREDLVALIGAGAAMIRVFEALDQEELILKWIPEWEHVRFLPQRNVLHRHTVDRHMLETAVRAAELTRTVRRPDLLLVAALLHDIGKGYEGLDHSEYGEQLIRPVAIRMGFSETDAAALGTLVKHHLLLSATATRRDLDDPQTIEFVAQAVGDPGTLELLHALSISDGEATGRAAWSDWKASLVADLTSRVHDYLVGKSTERPAPQLELSNEQLARVEKGELSVTITPRDEVLEISIIAPDQTGLLSNIAGVLTISRMDVRSARTRSHGAGAAMTWLVSLDANANAPSEEQLHSLIAKALQGELELGRKIEDRIRSHRQFQGIKVPPPVVRAMNDIATNATVIEVRMHDRPGVLFTVAKAISRFGVDIRAAIVATLGAEAFDTLYVTDINGGALSEERAALLANQLENLLITQ
jgi:[protein-PII] uridylyltransferase